MDDKLKGLIAAASAKVGAIEKALNDAVRQADIETAAKDRAKFYAAIDSALGPEILSALGPLAYEDDFLKNAISFAVDGRTFKIQQVTGTLANLETTLVIYLQFQLQNPDARERFLDALGKALA